MNVQVGEVDALAGAHFVHPPGFRLQKRRRRFDEQFQRLDVLLCIVDDAQLADRRDRVLQVCETQLGNQRRFDTLGWPQRLGFALRHKLFHILSIQSE